MKEYKKIGIYIIVISILLGVYAYAGLSGWKIWGSNTEKWSPEGDKKYHK